MNFHSLTKKIASAIGYHDDMDPFIRDIFPLLIVYRAMARCPFKTNEHGKLEVKLLSINGIYFLLVYGFVLILLVDSYCEDDIMSYFKNENFSSTIVGMSGLLITVLHLSVPLSLMNLWGPMMSYFDEWAKVNANFVKMMGPRKRRYLRQLILFTAFSLPTFSFATMMPLTSVFFGRYWYHTCVAPIVFISTTIEMCIFSYSCVELMYMSSQIDSRLKSLVRNERTRAQEIYEMRRLWMELAHLIRETGYFVPVPLFLELGSTTAFFSICAFGGISCLITGKEDTLQYLTVFTVAAFRLSMLFESGEQIARHAGKTISETLLTVQLLNLDYSAIEEVDLFIQSIKSNYPTINLGGLTRISRRELLALMMEALLYILILIQMQMSSRTKRKVTF